MRRAHATILAGLATAPLISPPAAAIQWCSDVSADRGVAACGDITAGDIIVGLKPVEVQELMRELFAQESAAVRKIEELSRQLGVTEAATKRFFEILGEQQVPVEQLPERLAEIAQRHKGLLQRADTIASPDPQVAAFREAARQAIETGEYDRAEGLINEAKAADLAAIERMQTAIDARKLSAADAAAENGRLMMIQLRYADAARYFAEAAALTPETSSELLSARLRDWTEAAWRNGNFAAALSAARRALTLDEERLPADDARLASRLNNLALMLDELGRYAEAEPLYKRAIAIGEKTLGPDHPNLAPRLNNLAGLYRATGRYDEAEPLFQRAIAIGETTLGPDHPNLATDLNNLANLYRDTGRYADAEPLFQRTLAIFEKSLPPSHPNLRVVRNNYAALLDQLEQHDEAAALRAKASAAVEK